MIPTTANPARFLEMRRIVKASREKAFAAWTQPDLLKKWWGVDEGATVPIAEVDLQVGGKYRLGMLPPNSETVIVLTGEYKVIEPPEKLIFSWGMEGQAANDESLITLRFIAQGSQTEIILTHEFYGPAEMGENFRQGWTGMFQRFEQALD